MRPILICPDPLAAQVLGSAAFPGERPVYLVATAAARARLVRRGERALAGSLDDPEFYRRALKGPRGPAVVAAPEAQLAAVIAAVREAAPDAPLLVVRDDDRPVAGAVTVPLTAFGERVVQPAAERAQQRARAERVRALFEGAERVLILMQDDPDPDAIASALALKTLLGRSRASAPICTFGSITRPENVAMCKVLDIEVDAISAQALDQFDRVALVDVQPSFLEQRFDEVDLVIDHHPLGGPINARMKDVRPSYGATSTILVEYLRAADVKIAQRLATALLYGIKSDTLGLERGGSKADLEAFSYLYLLANHNALRRIERPDLSEAALDTLAHGLARRQIVHGVFFAHLGQVATADLIPQFADFGLQAEGVEWSVVSGIVADQVHISVRNVGYVRSAGEVTRAAFGDLGSAGGHRTMAKAVIPLRDLIRGAAEAPLARVCEERIVQRFLRALGQNGKA
ncbi:MAG TPA: bifunctional oligoribonuclease/PAP phosphatase NrnA [Methylomirabilota bacterium]|nr:bifunctional oligoribonuclease/PAP phosphatase NrnA [Methylomirabilota bacterium]